MSADDRLLALGDEYSAAILAATGEPASARALSEELDVPIATCYRRIEGLVEAGFLVEAGREISDRGRRTSVYRRTVDELTVSFADGEVRVATTDRIAGDASDDEGADQ